MLSAWFSKRTTAKSYRNPRLELGAVQDVAGARTLRPEFYIQISGGTGEVGKSGGPGYKIGLQE